MEAAKSRVEYEWGAEREELMRERDAAHARETDLEKAVAEAHEHEEELTRKCADRADKLEQMKKLMDDQEHEMTTKIDRVQQYVKERQAGALHAEKKQQDAERMAERWQGEVRRLQAETQHRPEQRVPGGFRAAAVGGRHPEGDLEAKG